MVLVLIPEELFSLNNVVLFPNCTVATPECFNALEELITVNLKAFFSCSHWLSLNEWTMHLFLVAIFTYQQVIRQLNQESLYSRNHHVDT